MQGKLHILIVIGWRNNAKNISERFSVERWFVYFKSNLLPGFRHTYTLPWRLSRTLTSSENRTCPHYSSVRSLWRLHHWTLFCQFFFLSSKFFAAALPEYPRLLSSLLVVFSQTVESGEKLLKGTWSLFGLENGCLSSHRRRYLSPLSVLIWGRPSDFLGSDFF